MTESVDQPDQQTKSIPQVPEDHADVVTTAAEHGEQGVTVGSLQWASRQAAVVFHMADHRLNGASSSQQFRDGPADAAPGAADQDLYSFDAMAPVATIDEGHLRALIGQHWVINGVKIGADASETWDAIDLAAYDAFVCHDSLTGLNHRADTPDAAMAFHARHTEALEATDQAEAAARIERKITDASGEFALWVGA